MFKVVPRAEQTLPIVHWENFVVFFSDTGDMMKFALALQLVLDNGQQG